MLFLLYSYSVVTDKLLIICMLQILWWFLLQKLKASSYILYENVADKVSYIKFFEGRSPALAQRK